MSELILHVGCYKMQCQFAIYNNNLIYREENMGGKKTLFYL